MQHYLKVLLLLWMFPVTSFSKNENPFNKSFGLQFLTFACLIIDVLHEVFCFFPYKNLQDKSLFEIFNAKLAKTYFFFLQFIFKLGPLHCQHLVCTIVRYMYILQICVYHYHNYSEIILLHVCNRIGKFLPK